MPNLIVFSIAGGDAREFGDQNTFNYWKYDRVSSQIDIADNVMVIRFHLHGLH
jgi:hypothetical protein